MYESWIAMEQFYYQHFPNVMWIIVIGLIVFTLSVYNLDYKPMKYPMVVSGILVLALGLHLARGYNQHADLIDLSASAGPGVRDYTKHFYIDEPYSKGAKNLYRGAYIPHLFEKLDFYELQPLAEPVDYLGTDGQYYYFEVQGQPIFTTARHVEFTDTGQEAHRVGKRYVLADPRFQALGFVNQSARFHEYYSLPKQVKDQAVAETARRASDYPTEVLLGWILP